ncbi:Asparagine synthetase (glutamine-hydrolyzing) [Rubrivivax sp. A210]|uniref:asparagine synthetase B family protein n=1 Tax=Rubrivivax sp. A210 TaxID=2772301 RepID=UPI00191A702C|nr:asparagine synthase C-terminal domain-containing protein [Rubrivivax sp. A210]CAD5375217.1 Asparagine synthetase (glutamine-hydrolyzing) [Rubrivivax sp. A210]
MPQTSTPYFSGQPRFSVPEWRATEVQSGAPQAWQQALQGTPAATAAAATAGHFAAAFTDGDGRSFLAVDRFATQPLYYRVDAGVLRHAERADALADADTEIDPQALLDYLYFHVIPSPRTVFKGVHRMRPGHCATFQDRSLSMAAYWKPSFEERTPASFAAARDEFRALLADAVASQLDGSQPACFLSGGTDSSTIVGLMAQVTGKKPVAHSIGFEAAGYDEIEFARIAARRFGAEHHEHYIRPADLVRLIPALAAHHDQPFGNSSALPTYFCALKAHEGGATRLLAGDGGDELFGGNTRYAKQRVFAQYDKLPEGLRRGLLEPLADGGLIDRIPLLQKGSSYVRQARVPMPDRLQTYNLLDRLGRETVLTPALRARVTAEGPQAQEREVWRESQGADFINRMLAYDWRYTLAENDLPKVRGGTELAGVSVAYPLLDQRVVDFSARLPVAWKLKGMRLRWFFKEALRGFLPDEIITKKKHGFGLPFGVWASQDAALGRLARDSVRGLGERGIVRREFTSRLVDEFLPQHPGYYGEMVWIMMMLEQWFLHHRPDWRLPD